MKKLIVILFFAFCFQNSISQSKTIQTSGDVLLFTMPAVAIGSTIFKKDYKGTWQFTKGAVLNFALSFGLKAIVVKERPNLENTDSFPSGHTSITFQSASFLQRRYGWKYGIPAYLLASYTGFSRIHADKHDVYDVLVGAVIGIGSTYLFTTPYQQEHMELGFSGNKDEFLIGFKFKF
ncbi:phosphatase PAP2 family protein [Aureibaculum sp. A20]|uniref:Phosphatase PAP2 family protein n=1 Tax=Aureibaculum flavum TaxID=2795986 RepID=A0ABS0WS55_9FLAO|nr:phosphatase PAP2 family protein [Aureibaculum flavum]MBJ2174769.1 phosphatase PAP2 family protein [Aureibaculum flavum]